MNPYQQLIVKTINTLDRHPQAVTQADAAEIEDYMRHTIFNSTLDWQTQPQLMKAALEAWEDILFMRSDEGQAYMNTLLATHAPDAFPDALKSPSK